MFPNFTYGEDEVREMFPNFTYGEDEVRERERCFLT